MAMLVPVERLFSSYFPCLFPSCRVAGKTVYLSSPHRPARLLGRSQPSTFQVSLARVFQSYFRPSSLSFPWYIRSEYFPLYVFFISSYQMLVPVQSQSSLHDLSASMSHSRCSSDVFAPDLVLACRSARPSSLSLLVRLNPFIVCQNWLRNSVLFGTSNCSSLTIQVNDKMFRT